MLGLLVELLLQLLVEAFLQLLAEVPFELGFEALAHSVRRGRFANPVLAGIGLVIIGAIAGSATCWLFPDPLLRPSPRLPGLSLVLAPLATGAAMHALGSWRRRQGGDPTLLATFWGGALFAFAMGAARAVCLARA
jgi:hypothetical protein